MDMFEKKRGMMGQLLEMLKQHASDEVDSGLRKPEGEGDMAGLQVEKVEILPDHEMDEPTPEHEIDTKVLPEGEEHVIESEALEGKEEPMKADASAPEADVTDEEAGEEPSFPMMFGKKRKK